ncbi:trypsin-like serine peptidase [Streptoalloteichus hindustanus]|uniref:Serine protease n=1 Tax=Streptoalloteichus hindustanus TaxID=2017 RepID=A0A1M4UBI5_STRHI|nr:serine protease [Streptoalloteichus hindustanus]SHE54006.1 Trypsin-like peptidase domain-containing protein [Streptoalloteichus hindustanus]
MRTSLRLIVTALLGATPVLAASAVALPATGLGAAETAPAVAAPAQGRDQAAEEVGTEEAVSVAVGGDAASTTIRRPGAWYVKVHLSDLNLRPGDQVTVASPDRSEVHTYSAEPRHARPDDSPGSQDDSGFWALSVTGDTAVVSVRAGNGAAPSRDSRVAVDRITRGYTEEEEANRRSFQVFSICGNNNYKDAVCYKSSNPKEFSKTPPVARLLMNGRSLCTGWRVGDKNRMLTNNHCFADTATAKKTEVWFNYQCPTCGGSGSGPVTKVLANSVLKTNSGLDFTLFDVQKFASIKSFGNLELDVRVPAVGEEMYIVQHPRGQLKKLALTDDKSPSGNCQVKAVKVDGSSKQADISYMCDTEGGSSGSPVLSRRTHKVIGLHHFGGCPNQGVRIDLVAAQIRSLL